MTLATPSYHSRGIYAIHTLSCNPLAHTYPRILASVPDCRQHIMSQLPSGPTEVGPWFTYPELVQCFMAFSARRCPLQSPEAMTG